MALQVVPDEDLPETAPPTAQTEVPGGDLPEVPENDLPSTTMGTPSEPTTSTLGATIEGGLKGIAGPLAPAAELGLSKLGVPYLSAEEQTQRAEEHPVASGVAEATTLLGSSFIPVLGEYTLGSKIAQVGGAAAATAKALEVGKVGQTALKLAIEGGVFHTADNVSKMILGQTDPDAPVASFLAGTPTAMLFGGGLGYIGGKAANKLQDIAKGKSAAAASDWLANFGSRYGVRSKASEAGVDIGQAAADEAQHLYDASSAAVKDGFALKRESVEKLTQNIDPAQTSAYVNGLRSTLANLPRNLATSGVAQDAISEWQKAVTPTTDIVGGIASNPSAADVFEATDMLKRKLSDLSGFEFKSGDPDIQATARSARALYGNLKSSLENSGMWGDMGDFQKQLNEAYSKAQNPIKFFKQAAIKQLANPETGKVIETVNPDALANVFKRTGKGLGSIANDKIGNALEPMQNLLKTIEDLHIGQGLESPVPKVATPTLDEMLQKNVPAGAKAADWLFDKGPGAIGWAGGHAVGTAVGAVSGHPYLGYRAGEHLAPLLKNMGERPTNWAVSAALRALSGGNPAGISDAIGYAGAINKGANAIENGVNNLFAVGGKQYMNSDHSDKEREKLKKYVESGTQNQQIQNQANQPSQVATEEQHFAHGGEVLASKPAPTPTVPVGKITSGMDHISTIFPEQSMLLSAAKGRINNYLNSIRPNDNPIRAPFDSVIPDKEKEQSYNKALDIANQPLSVLDHVKNGTLHAEHMQHLNQLYPELTQHLQKKISQKMVEAQLKDEKPPYKVRQSMSLFMGSALDSNLTPQNIMAAQATFANQKMQNQGNAAPKGNMKSLDKYADQSRTAQQSLQLRQSHPKP